MSPPPSLLLTHQNAPPPPPLLLLLRRIADSLYKQATVGDSDDADQPWMVQWEASLKWNAWTEHRGLTKDEAMRAYVAELGRQIEKYSPVAAS